MHRLVSSLQWAILLALLLACSHTLARDKKDVIVLRNGDRITGEIKKLEYGVLQLSTDDMGTVNIEWDGVVSISSPYEFDVERIAPMAKRLLRWQDFESHIAWLYTPLALPLARALSPEVVVYDRTVEPSVFDQTAPPLGQLQAADVVFAREFLERVS